MTLYLKDAIFIDWQTLDIKTTCLAVEEGSGKGISFLERLPSFDERKSEDRVINCSGKIVTKSFGCGHHHIYSTLARGMPSSKKIPGNFLEILKYIWWHLDKCLDLEMVEASALAAGMFCAKNGVTLIVDHHSSPFCIDDSLFTIAHAFDKIGLSHCLCYEISDRDGQDCRDRGLAETDRFLATGYRGHVGLHASFTVGDELFDKAVNLAVKYDTGVHLHVAEDPIDQQMTLDSYGMSVVERLKRVGALDLEKSILSHCIHLTDHERSLIKESGVWVAENIESNQNNNVGVTSYKAVTDNVILGTDGMHSDMLRSAKAAFLGGQATENVSMDEVYRRFRNIHRYATDRIGETENDLVILKYESPTDITAENFLGHFIYGIDSFHVDTVISGGKIIVDSGRMTTVNEAEILRFSQEMGRKLWEEMKRRA